MGRARSAISVAIVGLACVGCSAAGSGAAPSASTADPAAAALAGAVDILAGGCRPADVRGAGAVIAGNHILTAAHVVSGAESITVRSASPEAAAVDARLVAIDAVHDLALLDVEPGALADRRPLDVDPDGLGVAGDTGNAVLFRDDAAVVAPYTIVKPVVVNILDIHHEHEVSRPGYQVDIAIAAGDSGAVMVSAEGRAIGVLYAKSRADDGRAFATDTQAVTALVTAAGSADPVAGIDTGSCV